MNSVSLFVVLLLFVCEFLCTTTTILSSQRTNPLWLHFEKILLRYRNYATVQRVSNSWFRIEPTLTCDREELVGKFGDGVKWLCGVRELPLRGCVIYSIGSHGEDQFERELNRITSCEVFFVLRLYLFSFTFWSFDTTTTTTRFTRLIRVRPKVVSCIRGRSVPLTTSLANII